MPGTVLQILCNSTETGRGREVNAECRQSNADQTEVSLPSASLQNGDTAGRYHTVNEIQQCRTRQIASLCKKISSADILPLFSQK
jgi:hypothetical protein